MKKCKSAKVTIWFFENPLRNTQIWAKQVCGSLYSPYLAVGRQVSAEANWHAIVTFAVVRIYNGHCRLKLIWADGAYVHIVEEVRKHFGWKLDIVRRSDKAKGFEILPHRWIVERTFGWLGRYRRLSRDFEHTVSSPTRRKSSP